MDKPTLANLEYDCQKRKTRREIFLERMESLIPGGTARSTHPPALFSSRLGPETRGVVCDAADSLCAVVLPPQQSRQAG